VTPDAIVGLLADPGRMRVLAAVALGARTDPETAAASGLSAREAAAARRRLAEGGLLVVGEHGWEVDYAGLRAAARDRSSAHRPAPGEGGLAPFVAGRRLRSLPAAQGRRRLVLQHVASTSFDPGADYDEPAVDERLRAWCDGGEVDHVALRRYLVDGGLLLRGGGVYRLAPDEGSPGAPPAPGTAERLVRALGLS